jgi:hypothetical protein
MALTPSGIAKEATQARRYANPGILTFAAKITATTQITPSSSSKSIRLLWIQSLPSSDNTAGNFITVQWHAAAASLYCGEAISHWQQLDAPSANLPLDVILTNAQPVHLTVHYEEF